MAFIFFYFNREYLRFRIGDFFLIRKIKIITGRSNRISKISNLTVDNFFILWYFILSTWNFGILDVTMNESTFNNDISEIIRISKEYDAEKVFLFGSCLDKMESAKDIDIAVKGVNPDKFFEMYGRILGVAENEIDLIPIENVREHFANTIFEKGMLIYGK